jgi:hypothetical protein
MSDAIAVVDAKIRELTKLERELDRALKRELSKTLRAHVRGALRANRSPDGDPIARRQDGAAALERADRAIKVVVRGDRIEVRLTKRHLVLHHLGRARGGITRELLPTEITPELQRELEAAAKRVFERFTEASA